MSRPSRRSETDTRLIDDISGGCTCTGRGSSPFWRDLLVPKFVRGGLRQAQVAAAGCNQTLGSSQILRGCDFIHTDSPVIIGCLSILEEALDLAGCVRGEHAGLHEFPIESANDLRVR
jgi:hypothetical protein